MSKSITLRFRDFENETIEVHAEILRKAGWVWWGWRKKEDEIFSRGLMEEISALARNGLIIGLYNRMENRFYLATLAECVYSKNAIRSPDAKTTPKYYSDRKLPAWFKLNDIAEVSQTAFEKKLGNPPAGDWTLSETLIGKDQSKNAPDIVKLKSNRILHISDIHLGKDYGFPGEQSQGGTPLLDVISRDLNGREIGLVVFSGDLTTRGDASTLQNNGVGFLKKLAASLKLSVENILVVPGNHDIALRDFTEYDYSHETPYNLFLKEFYGTKVAIAGLTRYSLPTGKLIDLMRMNSVRLRDKETSNYGYLEWHVYRELLEDWPSDDEILKVAVLHHHLVPAASYERLDAEYPQAGLSQTLDAGAVVEGLQTYGFSLALNGHQHVPAVSRISRAITTDGNDSAVLNPPLAVVAAGSAGSCRLSDAMRDNSYNIISFENGAIEVDVRRYNKGLAARRHFTCSLR